MPDVLLSGNHKEIQLWRSQKSLERTLERRNDLISNENYKIIVTWGSHKNFLKDGSYFDSYFRTKSEDIKNLPSGLLKNVLTP